MGNNWRHPGWLGAVMYAVGATLAGGLVTVVSRLSIAHQRGRRRVAAALPDGGIIVISNHTSYADGVLLVLVCRRLGRSLRLLATAGVFRAPLIGGLVRRLGFIQVDRGAATASSSLDAAMEALEAGEAVGIFPEGRTTRDPEHWPERAKTGAVRLALRSGAPIVPVAMVGAHQLVGRRRHLRHLVSSIVLRPNVETAVGEQIDVRQWVTDPDDPDQVRAATDRVMSVLIDLIEDLRGELAPAPTGVIPTTE
jgi:1-acyl-sn-glycerol-3-phosphate acyltransferase